MFNAKYTAYMENVHGVHGILGLKNGGRLDNISKGENEIVGSQAHT